MRRIGVATAEEVAATGIDWTFAPTVAVVRDVRWGRSYESYSESPTWCATMRRRWSRGLQGRVGTAQFMLPGHTLASVKHFSATAAPSGGRDQGETLAPEAELAGCTAPAIRRRSPPAP